MPAPSRRADDPRARPAAPGRARGRPGPAPRAAPALLGALALLACALVGGPARALDVKDLPVVPALAPCPSEGPGFHRTGPSGPCLRISGRVRAEAGTPLPGRPGAGPGREPAGVLGASGRLAVDARTETDYGPARAYIRFGTGR
ncbi:hypothetical protein OPKNFCMD_3109 [Methylobacterium crusticola]|uniref:Porin n=1 Tax=Methylobacterium crusticola TaxID=1697972 RepID=A0ABQ4QY77_9HYPH|nr:porin [Methylobacterium crusticola]GJD50370.1 hypothetical protein OPKNFCMD_3109 [Methylobacterium crusticola]